MLIGIIGIFVLPTTYLFKMTMRMIHFSILRALQFNLFPEFMVLILRVVAQIELTVSKMMILSGYRV